MTAVDPDDWTLSAKCKGMGDALFPEPGDQQRARVVCRDCPVRLACLAEALDHRIEYGVWGGTTERERRSMLRRWPQVTSWRTALTQQLAGVGRG